MFFRGLAIALAIKASFVYAMPPMPGFALNQVALNVYKGWNLLASPVNEPFDTSQIPIQDNQLYIFDTASKTFKSRAGVKIDPGIGFWVKASRDTQIKFSQNYNNPFSLKTYKPKTGWNLLGMSADSERVNTIAQELVAQELYVYLPKNAQDVPEWLRYGPTSRDSVRAGQGFWVKTVQ